MTLVELGMINEQIAQLDQQMATLLAEHHGPVERLAEAPGLGVDSAQQIIPEVDWSKPFGATPTMVRLWPLTIICWLRIVGSSPNRDDQ
jgi:hypothetical protein